ncbi:hypothetical protein E0K83_05315 [Gramella sp. BOM4]|nr:hypothetical protein [Christiangramia bathymodioli]
MKKTVLFATGLFILAIFASCGSNKNLQEDIPAQFSEVYYKYTSDGIKLHIPLVSIQEERISLDAVYFHGMKSPLVQSEERSNLYVANFRMGSDDMIMHEDPKKEYGNTAPQKPEKSPVNLDNDEALLVFTQDNQTKYYKLTGIVEKE